MIVSTTKIRRLAVFVVVLVLWIGKSLWREDQWMVIGSDSAIIGEQHPHFSDFEHFLVHIPKSGGSFAFDKLIELLVSSPEWQALSPDDRSMICDGRTRPTKQFETHYPYTSQQRRYLQYRCNFWMAEQPYTPKAQANYVIVRSPRSHILSQYFHCKESINHYDRWKYMPSLQEWLQAWVDAIDNTTLAKENAKFQCFDPRNLQSRFAGTLIEGPGGRNNATDLDLAQLERQLQERFVVVGDNTRMHTSVCMIFIRYTGGWIPPSCDCSHSRRTTLTTTTTTTTLRQELHHQDDHPTSPMTDRIAESMMMKDGNDDDHHHHRRHHHHPHHRSLKIHLYGHGVRHHGSAYPTTPKQDALLARLTDQDERLYRAGQTVFDRQLQRLEEEFGIPICEG